MTDSNEFEWQDFLTKVAQLSLINYGDISTVKTGLDDDLTNLSQINSDVTTVKTELDDDLTNLSQMKTDLEDVKTQIDVSTFSDYVTQIDAALSTE